MKHADLHMHTVASDGTDTLEERIEDAKKQGIDCIAITDHDKLNEGLGERSFKAENGIEVISGAEIKSKIDGTKIEILAYFIDPDQKDIRQLLEKLSEKRISRIKEFVKNLNNSYNFEIDVEDVLEKADGNVGRPHLAETLVEENIVDSTGEAFEDYIGESAAEYVAIDQVKAEEVIEKVHRNGGVTSLAHPGRSLNEQNAGEKVRKLTKKGLDGIEVEYTYKEKKNMDSYTVNFGADKASELAEKYDLIKTGGSDCHGSRSEKYYLGKIKIPYNRVETLKTVQKQR